MSTRVLLALCAFLVLPALVLAHGTGITKSAGPYTIELHTDPERLEPGDADFTLFVSNNSAPVGNEPVWVRIEDDRRIYFAGTFESDANGAVAFTYRINTPGWYTVNAEVRGNRVDFPVRVYGQYILLFGFLASVLIVLALLVKKL